MQPHSPSERDAQGIAQHSPDSSSSIENHPLVVRDLNKRYKGGVWANRDINLIANPGEILGILGPNGAGKTTLVRQITTELLPTSGSVRVLGHDVVEEPVVVKGLLGILPQEATLFEYLTVSQHLRIFAKLRGFPGKAAARRADELVQDLELSEYRDVPVDKLSGGLRRRVLVGIASAARPPVMVLDEPTTGLDPQSRRNLWSLLRRYKEAGAFVLITTHSMEEAEAMCDRVGIIDRGRLLALDTVANLRAENGFDYKITYVPTGNTGDPVTVYGADDQELIAQIRDMGVRQFEVARTSLEDVYFGLIGNTEGSDDREL